MKAQNNIRSSLTSGNTIGVMAPSSFVEKLDIQKSKETLEAQGFKIFVHPQTYARDRQSAGTAQEKLDALHDLYSNTNIDAIWAAGGGNRALYLLNELNYQLIAENPKPLIGFSDVTVLLNAIYTHTGVENFHAQVFKSLHNFEQLDQTLDVLTGLSQSMCLERADIINHGAADGKLIGGCLSLFQSLLGSEECPDLNGAILFLEDTGDEISRFDRMLAHMQRLGVFEQINGLILGEFHDLKDGRRPFGFTLLDIISELTADKNIPVVINAPFGHGQNLTPLPVGRLSALDTATKTIDFSVK